MKTIECLKLYDNNNSNLIIEYLEYAKLYKSKATIQIYSSCLKRFYDFLFFYYDSRQSKNIQSYYTTVLYNKVDRKCVEGYIAYQVNKKVSADFIHCMIMAVKNYFKYLLKLKKISTETFFDIFDELKTPKIIVKKQLLIKADKTLSITKAIAEKSKSPNLFFLDQRNIFMLLLMSNTGIRRKELACIDITNININNNTITIYKTKGDKPRIISFSDSIKSKLIEYLKLREERLSRKNKKHNMLFIKKNSEPLNINTISTIMDIISKKTNIKVTCHSLRRGFATDMAESGTDIYVISKMLGHQNINTTVSRYIYVMASMIKEAMQNHPFAKKNREKQNSTKQDCTNSDKNIKSAEAESIKNMLDEWKDLSQKMNEIINHLPRETDLKKA